MLFNSWQFLILLGVTFLLFYLRITKHIQTLTLVAASLVFYAYENPYLLILLLGSILANSILSYALLLDGHKRHAMIGIGAVVLNVGILCFFKYAPFFFGLFLTPEGNPDLYRFLVSIPLPIGISFYTFEGISLIVDLLRSRGAPHVIQNRGFLRHLRDTSLFVSFFPHLISGPILKARDFYPQIVPKHFANIPWTRIFQDVVTGYFLKLVVADNLKDLSFYMDPERFSSQPGSHLLALLMVYSFQIFADFAGYSLIALGLARLFGYDIPQNFNFPYIAASIREFWQRWHISLSQWLRDYLYIPLGGNRRGRTRTYVNLLVVMGIGGLWHGAASSFLVWGLYHGAGLAVERFFAEITPSFFDRAVFRPLRIVAVFAFVTTGWLLFKLTTFGLAWDYILAIGRNWSSAGQPAFLTSCALFCMPVIIYHLWYLFGGALPEKLKGYVSPIAYGFMLFCILLNSGTSGRFIYFQF